MLVARLAGKSCAKLALSYTFKEMGVYQCHSPRCRVQLSIQRTMAGHSKWANIKFKKMHKDNARSKMFAKIAMEIISAVKGNY